MLSFSTDDLRPQDRFDHWCEVRGKALFGVTIELPRERRGMFHGRFSATDIGGAIVSQMRASSYLIKRTDADIARMASDSLCIGRQLRGPGWLDVGQERGQSIFEGDLTISHSDLPFAATPERGDGFDFRMLKISLTSELLLGVPRHELFAATPMRGLPFLRPLSAMFQALTKPGAVAGAGEITHIARLGLLARGRLAAGLPEARAALRSGLLYAAREILARDLHRPSLSPSAVAAELRISLRQLHVLFEPTGESFARTLTALRIHQACSLLKAMPTRPVTDIAFACGFDSLATFYRVFRKLCAMAPGDLRALATTTATAA